VAQIKCTDQSDEGAPFKASVSGIGGAPDWLAISNYFYIIQMLTIFLSTISAPRQAHRRPNDGPLHSDSPAVA
jgi:hypothetical protein